MSGITRTAKIYATRVNLGMLREFIDEADRIGVNDDDPVRITVAPSTGYQMDPGGEITIEVTT